MVQEYRYDTFLSENLKTDILNFPRVDWLEILSPIQNLGRAEALCKADGLSTVQGCGLGHDRPDSRPRGL